MGDEMGTFRVTVEIEHPVLGLNLRIDPVSKRLVDAGPAPAAAATGAAGECVGALRSPDSVSDLGWH